MPLLFNRNSFRVNAGYMHKNGSSYTFNLLYLGIERPDQEIIIFVQIQENVIFKIGMDF